MTETPQPAGQTIVKAATVIVFRHSLAGPPELLMVKRSQALSFAASAVVFPGGKVSEADLALGGGDEDRAARIAAVRETLEETGLVLCTDRAPTPAEAAEARAMLALREDLAPVLERFGWGLLLDRLNAFAHWVPSFKPGRIFDTRFYLADIGTGAVDLTPDLGENTDLLWLSARDALAQIETGALQAIYPTRRNLERLAQFGHYAEVVDHLARIVPRTISPWLETRPDGEMLCIPADQGYPVTAAPVSQIRLD